jgi:CBS domain-containing protein
MTAPSPPRAAQFMFDHPCTVAPATPLRDIIERLLAHEVSNAPVVELREGKVRLVGFVSERDCLAALANGLFLGDPRPAQTAATLMRRHPVCVAPDTELFVLASIFVTHGYRHLPVVDGDELLGIVSRRDVLRALALYDRQLETATERARHPPDLSQIVNQRFIVRP